MTLPTGAANDPAPAPKTSAWMPYFYAIVKWQPWIVAPEAPGEEIAMAGDLFAWITERDGSPKLIVTTVDGFHAPLVFSDEQMAKLAHPLATDHGHRLGQAVRLVHFKPARVLESYDAAQLS
jgi:hypothetical protein